MSPEEKARLAAEAMKEGRVRGGFMMYMMHVSSAWIGCTSRQENSNTYAKQTTHTTNKSIHMLVRLMLSYVKHIYIYTYVYMYIYIYIYIYRERYIHIIHIYILNDYIITIIMCLYYHYYYYE